MAYYMEDDKVSLVELQKRIQDTDLVPSRQTLLDGISKKMNALKQQGVSTLANLRKELKGAKRLQNLSNLTGISAQYLTLLRREVESYFPKPISLKCFTWLPQPEITKLEDGGYRNTLLLHNAVSCKTDKIKILKSTGVNADVLNSLIRYSDLTKIQWVNHTAARMLVEADYVNPTKVAAADADVLSQSLNQVNQKNKYYKGKIGLRDIKRLIRAAGYVPK